jgi:hypothetical protein
VKRLLLTAVFAAGTSFLCQGAVDVGIGINIGPPPAPRILRVRPVAPGPGYVWIDGYWYAEGGRYRWHAGYWSHLGGSPLRRRAVFPGVLEWRPRTNRTRPPLGPRSRSGLQPALSGVARVIHKDSKGFEIVLDAFQVSGRVVLRLNTPRPKGTVYAAVLGLHLTFLSPPSRSVTSTAKSPGSPAGGHRRGAYGHPFDQP